MNSFVLAKTSSLDNTVSAEVLRTTIIDVSIFISYFTNQRNKNDLLILYFLQT